jgi:hypothetical protein
LDYAQEIPVRITAHILGISEDAGDLFRRWIQAFMGVGITDPAGRPKSTGAASRKV